VGNPSERAQPSVPQDSDRRYGFVGTVPTIVRKIPYHVEAPGHQDEGDFYSTPHQSKKPWFQAGVMFFGQLLAFVVYAIKRRFGQSR
jgi:hypothetical protein